MMVGFNRRWSPLVARAKAFMGDEPVQIVYRVKAGALPADHWLKDRRQGGRLIGEACHFIDVCNHLAGVDPSHVFASSLGEGELLLDDNFSLMLAYPNGSQALIAYSATAPTQGGKERVEILGRDRSVDIDDYHTIHVQGAAMARRHRYRPADKGHRRELEVFAAAVLGEGDPAAIARSAFVTSRTTFAAVRSLMTGQAVPVAQG
jgi:predicted dehydrogenase